MSPSLTFGFDPYMIVAGFVLVFAVIFAIYLALEKDGEEAAKKTTRRATGAAFGAGTVGLAVLVEGLHILAEVPGLVMGLLGIGAIFAGWSWEVAGAVFLVSYIVLMAIGTARRP